MTGPNPNIVSENKTVKRKDFNVPGYSDEEENPEFPDYEKQSKPSYETNFSFKKKVVERKNYNDDNTSSAEEDDDDSKDSTPKHTERQSPDIPESSYMPRLHRKLSDDRSSLVDEVLTFSYDKNSYDQGLDAISSGAHSPRIQSADEVVDPLSVMPSVRLEVDMNFAPNMPSESSDYVPDNTWARPYDTNATDKKDTHDYENFAYLHDLAGSEHNVTEI